MISTINKNRYKIDLVLYRRILSMLVYNPVSDLLSILLVLCLKFLYLVI